MTHHKHPFGRSARAGGAELRGGVSALALMTLGALGAPALAQDADASPRASGVEVITVTAQRQAESIQEVPIAVTALGADDIEAAKIEDAIDLQFNAPNIVFSGNRNLTIRGVGSQSFGGSNDAGIGLLVDGVFIQAPLTTQEYYDLQRIEVLRGPQGTLFGRNTTGGIVNYISNRAEEEFGGSLTTQLESFSGVRATGVINLPLTDHVYQRFAFNHLSRDGYTENVFDDSRLDGRNQTSVRSATRFVPGANTTADLILEFSSEDSDRAGAVKTLCTPDPAFGCSPDSVSTQFPTSGFLIDAFLIPGVARADKFAPNPASLREVNVDINPTRDVEEFIGSFNFTHDFGDLTFTSITGARRATIRSVRDFDQGYAPNGFNPGTFGATGSIVVPDDGAGNGVLTYLLSDGPVTTTDYNTSQDANIRSKQVSTEVQLTSEFDGPLNFIVGAYYLDFETRANVTTWTPANRTIGFVASGDTPEAKTQATAVFGELYYDVTDTFSLTGGLRYTSDEKSIITRSGTFVLGADVVAETTFEETTWRAAASWNPDLEFTDDTNLYASVSRGFKSGGFNPGSTGTGNATFEPEFITAYEFGAKNLMFDNRLQANAAVFMYDYENLIVGNIVGTLATNVNLPESEVRGLELELIAEPTDAWRIEAALGLLDAEIVSDFQSSDASRGGAFFQLQGNDLPNSPDHTLKLAAEYEHQLASGWMVRPRVDYYTQSEFFSREFNVGADMVESWEQLDLQVTFEPTDRDLSLTLFVKNALDEDSITFLETNSNLVGSFRSAFLLDPQIFGASVKVGF